ncbi:hypothetical protein C2S53_009867 [Perilla frutescens var. hirtella]|uniref:Protein kinase domain-containing protein n=1 Tax=Perilla frutescens var. hirtella TaxID=608512 RepID=A0AAD4JPB8_PERFH|nr:hypothetical protein C2S53_009867 [Perilla frutescens var. hirtella]
MLPLLLLAWFLLSGLSLTFAADDDTYHILKGPNITKPGCPSQCGNLTIPYPFGVGSGCGINELFELNCSSSTDHALDPPKALLEGLGTDDFPNNRSFQVLGISDGRVRVSNILWISSCYNRTGELNNTGNDINFNLTGTPYSFSEINKLTVIGCDDFGLLLGTTDSVQGIINSCDSVCSRPEDAIGGSCSGTGCCQTPLIKGQDSYSTTISSANNHSDVLLFNPCGYMFVGEQDFFVFRGASDLSDPNLMQRVQDTVPMALDWWIGNLSCEQAKNDSEIYACNSNSQCIDSDTELGGYRCSCYTGYQGNPYLLPGCIDIDECSDHSLNNCEKICTNTLGSFNCSCPHGQYGDGRKNGKGCNPYKPRFPVIKVALGAVFGFLSIVITATWLYFFIKKRKLLKQREKFFQRNGGILLQQKLSSNEGSAESIIIFTAEELQQATDDYADDRILGRGGCGTVYKGILPDKRIVAIKKSREIDETQTEQFINEVVILTQVHHRNVVKFLGCCLESEVPLLVFEYIPNGTLYEHIQHKSNWLSLENRLWIASEAAGALSYLHSAASTPIIHRDVKSANILLDEYYTAKISDFGASRLIPLDQTKVTTMVIGTFGYLDPEYFRTSQLTEKSDVYSFGVVLVELLTGGMPVNMEMNEDQRNLTTNFINSMRENRLFQILEPRVVREGSFGQLQATAELIERCVQLNREDRPTMKEVAAQIEMLRKNLWTDRSVDEEAVSLGSDDLYSAPISPYDSTQEFTRLQSWSSSTSKV